MGVRLLGRIKLYDIAKELNIPSKELVDLAIKLKMDVKSHLSAISEEDAEKLRLDKIIIIKTKI